VNIPSKYLEQVVDQFSTLPGIGKRTALRLAMHMLKKDSDAINSFVKAFENLTEYVKTCDSCGNISDSSTCSICTDLNRDRHTICVVEDIRDVMAIEATEQYTGIFHVLGGVISPMDGIGPHELNIKSLIHKCSIEPIKEVILALNATMEGDTTNFYLFKKLDGCDIKITSLTRGVAVGSELHYTDELTLGRSLTHRQLFENSMISR
jgi:recombination protein RecR